MLSTCTGAAAGSARGRSGAVEDGFAAADLTGVGCASATAGTTEGGGAGAVGTGVGAETLNYTGATSNDAHVATAGKFINAITLTDGTGTASNYQLPTLNNANAPVTINPL